jgi:hypothetical protein
MKQHKKKKYIIFTFLAIFLAYSIWLSFHLTRFRNYKNTSQESQPTEIVGVYHIHTDLSDGRKSPLEIAELAAKESLDFLILTDHGSPNKESLACQGWEENVLILAGSELSVSRGHLVALGFDESDVSFSQDAEVAVYQIQASNGFSIVAHPYSKTRWSWGKFIGYSGLEIIDGDSMIKKSLPGIIPFLPALAIKPRYVLLKMLKTPEKNLKKWDRMNAVHPSYGYFSSDAHILYKPMLSVLKLHVLLQAPLSKDFRAAKKQVLEALRKGSFYNAIDAAAEAHGFRLWGESADERVPMGGNIITNSSASLHVKAPFPFLTEAHLLHNGNLVLRSSKDEFIYETEEPGHYRVEVYLKERSPLDKNIPWILSNPIFLREKE